MSSSPSLRWFPVVVATLSRSYWHLKHIDYASNALLTSCVTSHSYLFTLCLGRPCLCLCLCLRINFKAFNSCSLTGRNTTPTQQQPLVTPPPHLLLSWHGDVIWTMPEHSFNCCDTADAADWSWKLVSLREKAWQRWGGGVTSQGRETGSGNGLIPAAAVAVVVF